MAILFFGEAICDLVSDSDKDGIAGARSFRPHFGGALANAAVAAARAGAEAELIAGVGDDELGHWLAARLAEEGVGRRWFRLVPGLPTPLAVIGFDQEREPVYSVYGQGIEAGLVAAVGEDLDAVIDAGEALVVGSNTLVGEAERELTLRVCERAATTGRPVVFDPNLRETRWADLELGRSLSRQVCAHAGVVRANLAEARWLAGGDPDLQTGMAAADCAAAIIGLGAELAVVTQGAAGAVAAGACAGSWPGVAIELATPLGAGDCFTGTLAAGLAACDWDLADAGDAIEAANQQAARVCEFREAVPPR